MTEKVKDTYNGAPWEHSCCKETLIGFHTKCHYM